MVHIVITEWKITESSFNRLQKQIDTRIKRGMKKFRKEIDTLWHKRAQDHMDTEGSGYKAYNTGLQITNDAEGVKVELVGWLPVHLETGFPPFDMKPGILKGRPYVDVPLEKKGIVRRMSQKSPPHSWWHPGWMGMKTVEHAQRDMESMVEKSFGGMFDRTEV